VARKSESRGGLPILDVEPESIAADLGWSPDDRIVAVNGAVVRDPLDYRFLVGEELVEVEVEKPGGERILFEIEKDPDDSLGATFGPIEPDRCGNQCTFCFVHQMPKGMRRSLYIKDEDYRLSFLAGHFTTMATITDEEVARIIRQRLSPQYISVHATEETLRRRLLGNATSRPILPLLDALIEGGIELHTQVVLMAGENDGAALERSLGDLLARFPGVRSVAVVPVGLTRFREKLPRLRYWTQEPALTAIEQVRHWQERATRTTGSAFVYVADEFYVIAGRTVPPASHYGDFPQLGNGVGMIRRFLDGLERLRRRKRRPGLLPLRAQLVTGRSAAEVMARLAKLGNQYEGVELGVLSVENRFFGGDVSCAGLLTGRDILEQAAGAPEGDLILPDILLGETDATRSLLLDDVSVDELASRSGRRVVTIPHEAEEAWRALCAWAARADAGSTLRPPAEAGRSAPESLISIL
jgi:putative radical SAM enzyme (TIGR03279 family)